MPESEMSEPLFRFEYVSPVAFFGPITTGQAWEMDFYLANRGRSVESYRVFLPTSDASKTNFPPIQHDVAPGDIGGHGYVFEAEPSFRYWETRWGRIWVTSRNLVPTLHYFVMEGDEVTPNLSLAAPFYVPPGGFGVFELPDPPLPPIGPIGPVIGATTRTRVVNLRNQLPRSIGQNP
jgi:hypothetical protein